MRPMIKNDNDKTVLLDDDDSDDDSNSFWKKASYFCENGFFVVADDGMCARPLLPRTGMLGVESFILKTARSIHYNRKTRRK